MMKNEAPSNLWHIKMTLSMEKCFDRPIDGYHRNIMAFEG